MNADHCYQNMKSNSALRKYRNSWISCIEKYESVYAADPRNPWASAGMYRAAQLYLELHDISYAGRDRSEAIDLLNRIIKRYPGSAYRARARKLLSSLKTAPVQKNRKLERSQSKQKAKQSRGEKTKQENEQNDEHKDGRSTTLNNKRSIKYLTKDSAENDHNPANHHDSGNNYGFEDNDVSEDQDGLKNHNDTEDEGESSESEKESNPSFPVKTSLAYKSKQQSLARHNGGTLQGGESGEPDSEPESGQPGLPMDGAQNSNVSDPIEDIILNTADQNGQAPQYTAAAKKSGSVPVNVNGDTYIKGLRYWSTPNYTRVVVDIAHERAYTHHLLKKNPSLNKPQRLYVDIEKSVLGKDVPTHTIINDNLLTQARAGQNTPHSVRVVVDIKSFDNYKIFSLKDPFRMVIDVWGDGASSGSLADSSIPPEQLSTIGSNTDQIHASAIAKQLALGVKTIVIDPGHGGKDPGALGYLKGVYEKDVVLAISKKLAHKMRQRLKCNVILTRSRDRYLTLEERTAIANTKNADLFISLHCNAAKSRKLTGIETYYLNLATDEQAINVAARENATSRKNISDLESILNDLMKNAKINESSRLSTIVQDSLYRGVSKKYSGIRNLGVKQAPFYVLLGATMPSILIETSFISNSTECKRLISSKYQNALCDAIINGVKKYIKQTDPRARAL